MCSWTNNMGGSFLAIYSTLVSHNEIYYICSILDNGYFTIGSFFLTLKFRKGNSHFTKNYLKILKIKNFQNI